MKRAIIIDSKDNVASLLSFVNNGDKVQANLGDDIFEFEIKESIRFGHKFATKQITMGENIIKYGEIIGRATSDIDQGCHVHVHNVESLRGRGDLT